MRYVVSFLIALSLFFCSLGIQAEVRPKEDASTQSGIESKPKWPYPIPARIADGPNKDLFIMTLGNVQPTLADGIYDSLKDEVRLKDGTIKSNYYRDTLGAEERVDLINLANHLSPAPAGYPRSQPEDPVLELWEGSDHGISPFNNYGE